MTAVRTLASLLLAAVMAAFAVPALAQSTVVVATCDAPSTIYAANQFDRPIIIDTTGKQCTSGNINNVVSSANSTTTPLGGGGVYTGTAAEITGYSSITVSVFANQASATDGLSMQQSSDGTNWDIIDTYTVAASTGKTFAVQVAMRYFRVVYTNGGAAQATFRLQTIFHGTMQATSSQRAVDSYSNETDLSQMQGFGMVYNGATWDRARGDTNGAYVVGSASAAAAAGLVPSATTVAAGALVLKASAGNLYGVQLTAAASAGYLMIFDATSAPADGTVTPKYCKAVAANSTIELSWTAGPPATFTTGITAVFSTTGCFTKTVSATAFISGMSK